MSKQARPPQRPWLSPYLTVKDAEKALDFYQRAFGFTRGEAYPGPDGKIGHAEMTYNEMMILFGPECSRDKPIKAPASLGTPSPVTLYVYCEDVDALCARAQAAGAEVELAPQDMFWGDRMCALVDPDGHRWSFATSTGQHQMPTAKT